MKNFGSTSGLTVLAEDQATPANGMVAHVTSSYNSGFQNGDIKGAFLSDTDDTDLVGSGELVTNGTFDTDTSGWSVDNGSLSVVSGKLRVQSVDESGGFLYIQLSSSIPAGSTVGIQWDFGDTDNSSFDVRMGFHDTAPVSSTDRNDGFFSETFLGGFNNASYSAFQVITTEANYLIIQFNHNNSGISSYFDLDNISVKLADEDRSVNNNGLIVNGTVTRSPVATGADLVAYSGFSASNYLEQPYNSDLDFGTGDFCVMGWMPNFAGVGTATGFIGRRIDVATTTGRFLPRLNDDETITLYKDSGAISLSTPIPSGDAFLAFVRRNGVLEYYINGQLTQSTAMTDTLTSSGATLNIGYPNANWAGFSGSLALWRISATAPTAEQIAKIYNDEKFLFQENAQATLYGTSDAVTALAHDPVTDLLHVGTSDGRSVFQGLRRVSNTTDAVSTAISASNNLIVEQ